MTLLFGFVGNNKCSLAWQWKWFVYISYRFFKKLQGGRTELLLLPLQSVILCNKLVAGKAGGGVSAAGSSLRFKVLTRCSSVRSSRACLSISWEQNSSAASRPPGGKRTESLSPVHWDVLCELCENIYHRNILPQCDFYAQTLLSLSKGASAGFLRGNLIKLLSFL